MKQLFEGMDLRQKIIGGIIVISLFIFLTTVLVFVYALSSKGEAVPGFLILFVEYHIQFMVLMGVFGVVSGLVTYSIMHSTIEREKKTAQTNLSIIMKFLGKEDKAVISLLASKGNMATQSDIARLEGMSRLKAHRVVRKLLERGIIHVDKHGKINVVRLVEELKNQME